jgi:nucleoside-diphosphate kinase
MDASLHPTNLRCSWGWLSLERTLVIVKPDAYIRGLTGVILARFEQRGLIVEEIRVSREETGIVQEHYPGQKNS